MDQQTEQAYRVNHAGETGAVNIYRGQLAVLKNKPIAATLKHMLAQEEQHLRYFNQTLPTNRVRPSLLEPFWRGAGFMLGASTALLGEKTALACTMAVEEVIDEHYQEQLDNLPEEQKPLKDKIRQFQAEEVEHGKEAEHLGGHDAPFFPLLKRVIQTGSRAAIAVAKKV